MNKAKSSSRGASVGSSDFGGYNFEEICAAEKICLSTAVKNFRWAKRKVAMRLYILTEIERLRNLYGPRITDEDIDDEVAESLAELIKNDALNEAGYHFI